MDKEDKEIKSYFPVNGTALYTEIAKLNYKQWQELKEDIDFMFQEKVDKVTMTFEEFKARCNKLPSRFERR